jgi:lipopolysaccharide assembly outer membrane protein LptD (OstA)
MKRLALAFVVLGVAGVSVSAQQRPSPVSFDAQMGKAEVVTWLHGAAERSESVNGVTTYRGNVVLNEIAGNIQIRADQVTLDEKTREFVLQGNVRLSVK